MSNDTIEPGTTTVQTFNREGREHQRYTTRLHSGQDMVVEFPLRANHHAPGHAGRGRVLRCVPETAGRLRGRDNPFPPPLDSTARREE